MADRVEIDLIVEAISKGFDKIEKDLKGVGTSAKESGDKARQGSEGTKAYGQSLANLKTAAMGAAVVIGGVLVAGLVKSVMAASDAEESLSKFNVVFKDLEGGPEGLAVEVDKLAEATGRSKWELIGAVGALGDLFQPLGFSADAAADLSLQMTSLAIDLSSFNNMPMDEALQRLQGTLIGSHENALAFGVVINENTLKAEMAANGTDKLTGAQFEQAKVQARLNLLMAGTTAAQGDAIRTADEFANQLKALQGEMQDLAVEIGQQFMPAALAMMEVLRDFVADAAPAVVDAAKFMASGLKTATDLTTGYGNEVEAMAASQLEAAKSTEDLSDSFNKFAGNLSGGKQFAAMITNTDDEIRAGVASIGTALAQSAGSFEEFNAEITKTEYGANILLNAIEATTGVVYDSVEAFYAAARAAKFSAQSDEILTRGLVDQNAVLEENTEAVTENAEATEQAAYVNEELADKVAQLAAQENALDPAVRAANLALEQQTEAERLAAEKAEELRVMTEALQTAMTGDFKTALEDTTGATTDWTQELFNQASQLGLTQAQMVLLAEATGNYTDEQIEAALQTAAMQEKVTALAAAIANDGMSIEEAIADLNAFQAAMDANAGATQRFIDKLNAIPSRIQVQIDVHGGEGITAPGGYQNPDAGAGSGGAATSGTGGASSGGTGGYVAPGAAVGANYVVPPGYNENWYQPVSSGERVVVTPDGSSPGGGNTYNLYVTATDGGANVAREFNYLRSLAGA